MSHSLGHHHHSPSLEDQERAVLTRGLAELLHITAGLDFRALPPEKQPFPLTMAVYHTVPAPEKIREEVAVALEMDPVEALEPALALLELYASNHAHIGDIVPEDMKFIMECFNSKRMNGWIGVLGSADPAELASVVNSRWQFRFFHHGDAALTVYDLLSRLVRYADIYGRTHYSRTQEPPRFMGEQTSGEQLDLHEMGHFIDEHCPGILVCHGEMTDLELALSLMAMRIGVPAIVPQDYPFSLGKVIRTDSLKEIRDLVVLFPNIRRLLDVPEAPGFPPYCDASHRRDEFTPDTTWGDTPESFFILRKGPVVENGWEVVGEPDRPMGIVVTVEGEPLDAFDRRYIERMIVPSLSLVRGARAVYDGERAVIQRTVETDLHPERIGEVLSAAIVHDFPKLRKVWVTVLFARERLEEMAEAVRREKVEREREIAASSEETVDEFCSCVGCSPFAPNHMCVLTPERAPQCGRPYEMIKTGALYSYDDMTNIHHSIQHRFINSFQMFPKGKCLDPLTGEWTGANEEIRRQTHGRTRRVLLHTLRGNPHTGCGCFQLILFETIEPRRGIGIMDRRFAGECPDGRSWKDLHFALAGKQAPGIAGASNPYLFSPQFLRGDNGWKSVVWVSPNVAKTMGDRLPDSVKVV